MTSFSWRKIPDGLQQRLLCGGWGFGLLLDNARFALACAGNEPQAEQQAVFRLGLSLMGAAWECSPLNGSLAASLLDMHGRLPFLPEPQQEALRLTAGGWHQPENLSYMQRLHDMREHGKLRDYLERQHEREPENLFWFMHCLDVCQLLGDWERVRELAATLPAGLAGVRDKYAGDAAFMLGDYEKAAALYAEAATLLPGPGLLRGGEAQLRAGNQAAAATAWRQDLKANPWRVNTLLKLYGLATAETHPPQPLSGDVAVLLYSYDKRDDLDRTLEALFASDLQGARVIVLDNGSGDGTEEMLRGWTKRLSGEAANLRVETLPVNIGAPAARNWLKRLPEVRAADWVVYLDDDALVPHDWLKRFGQAVSLDPDAAAWGCRVCDETVPRVQSADLHLRALPEAGDGVFDLNLEFVDTCGQDLDFGQLDYSRPCVSVTGCCHLFRGSDLAAAPDFDLRYSPTQYDDLDRDLQQFLRGGHAFYHGGLGVIHARKSGVLIRESRAGRGASYGNLVKLNAKYEAEQFREIEDRDRELMLDHVTEAERAVALWEAG